MASPAFAVTVSIDGPPPSAPALTLVGAARVVPETGDRWINGATIRPYGADLPDVWDTCQGRDASSDALVKADGTPVTPEVFGSFVVLQGITCTTRSIQDPAEWQARADKILQAREHWAIEREFWLGALKPDNPHLGQALGTTTLNSGAATNTRNAVALLEQAIADAGGDGVIHLRPNCFSMITQDAPGHLAVSGGVAKSLLGTSYVPGVGYPGTGPSGEAAAADTEWLYATGRIEIRRSDTFIVPGSMSEATDRAQNVTTFRAERYVLITWDQRIHAAVLVDRSYTTFTT